MPLDRGKPCLEIIGHDLGCEHADRMRPQMRVEPVAQTPRHKVLGNIAMGDLRQRMNAGDGTASAVDTNVFAANRFDGLFQRALHRGGIVLDLPAGERRAVIFDDKLVTGHQTSRTGGFSGVPRRNSAAFIGALPARCNSMMRSAPLPQAMARRSLSTWPAGPEPLANSQRKILIRAASPSPPTSLQAPGNGDNPWIWRSTERAGLFQSTLASVFSILAA